MAVTTSRPRRPRGPLATIILGGPFEEKEAPGSAPGDGGPVNRQGAWSAWGGNMTLPGGEGKLPEEGRKEIFQALVEAQDQEVGVAQSRRLVAERFGISEEQVRQIEREGLDHQWPPL